MDYLAEQVGEAHLDENGTGGSIKITVEDVDGDLPPRPSSAAVLARVLESRAYLDLTGKVFVEPLAIKTKHGGVCGRLRRAYYRERGEGGCETTSSKYWR